MTNQALDTPGILISCEPTRACLLPGIKLSARAWAIRYTTSTATGGIIEATGTVLVPTARSPHALIGYAVGTQGLAPRASAASAQLAFGLEYEAVFLAAGLRRGWVLAVPDYPGLGTGTTHPYVIGHALGPAVLDLLRAARQITHERLADLPIAITGYSEGGCAAGWALQLHPTYAPELPVVAGAVGAPPADLLDCYERHQRSPYSFLLAYGLIGLDAAYPDLHATRHLNWRGRQLFRIFRHTHVVAAVILGLIGWLLPLFRVESCVNEHPLDDPDVRAHLELNRLGDSPPSVPTFLATGMWDQAIPYRQTVDLDARWATAGAQVTTNLIPRREHITGALAFARRAYPFLDRHLVTSDQQLPEAS
ncbi:putative lipase [Gordonia effusa NBRC 100432]|uniref:Putative lipase n=1 Tax=Gordonia effusa NBRC 100432 TaxID=1077974 RepID=H0QUP4_9ACTN|nr:lipase family protein [Gordonia effusa]GAB16545.1 putative lipase [Gordonia effusa NBRC 100432]